MKLPFSFGLKKKEVKNYFLALLLQDERAGAVVLEESNGAIHVVGHAEERFPTALEEASFEEWLEVIDKAVSTAEASLPDKVQTEKTVFGVKQDWLEEGKIKKGYLVRLKKICEELSLQPIGFLVFTEAILHRLQQEEGAPVSAILVELGKKFISISIIRAGRIIETKLIPYEEPVPQTIDNALKEFAVEILPSRIILFNSEENKPLSQEFISHSWSKSLPFLHMPQITVLPATFDTKSVLYGTAAQLGFAVVGADTLPTKTRSTASVVSTPTQKEEPTEEETEEQEETMEKEEESENDEEKPDEPQHPQSTELSDTVSADYFGFVKNADVAQTPQASKKQSKQQDKQEEPNTNRFEQEIEELPEEEKEEETKEFESGNLSASAGLLFTGVKTGIAKLLQQKSFQQVTRRLTPVITQITQKLAPFIHKNSDHGRFPAGKQQDGSSPLPFPLIWLAVPGVILVIIAFVLFDMFGMSAKVSVTIDPKVLTNTQQITFTTDGSNNFDQGVINAQTISTDEKGTVSQQATGTKSVGTPAKGTVTIFNLNTSPASLSAGTTLVAENGKKFTLDKDVNVPSADPFQGTGGQATTTVTAADIGPDYNMPSGTKFTIGSSGNIGAKNDTAFSGGTKKDVIIVSQADVDKLTSTLISNYEDKAKTDLGQQVGSGKMLLPFFTKEDLSQQTLSKKVGDEAQTVSLDATATYQGIVVDKSDLTQYASHVLQIPDNMTLTPEGIQTDLQDIKQAKTSVSGTLNMKASLLPKIDTTQLAQTIAGKSFQQAEDSIKALPQVASVDVTLSPNLPFFPKNLPRLPNHISITLTTQ